MNIKLSVMRSFLGLCLLLPFAAQSAQFSIVVIPDTQFYAEANPEIIDSQMNWIVANEVMENIIYVAHLGDIKDDGFCDVKSVGGRTEWEIVDQAFDILDVANIPYGVVPGNHDFDHIDDGSPLGRCPNYSSERPLSNYNLNFGPGRFAGDPWYGDPTTVPPTPGNRVPLSNEDNFTLVESNGVKFIFINLAYKQQASPPGMDAEVTWANDLLTTYSDRLAIVTTHYFLEQNPDIISTDARNVLGALCGANLFRTHRSSESLYDARCTQAW